VVFGGNSSVHDAVLAARKTRRSLRWAGEGGVFSLGSGLNRRAVGLFRTTVATPPPITEPSANEETDQRGEQDVDAREVVRVSCAHGWASGLRGTISNSRGPCTSVIDQPNARWRTLQSQANVVTRRPQPGPARRRAG
jgi:hypothetical protein